MRLRSSEAVIAEEYGGAAKLNAGNGCDDYYFAPDFQEGSSLRA
jgi:hypothetical protein